MLAKNRWSNGSRRYHQRVLSGSKGSIIKEKEKYYKIVDSLTVLISHLHEKYEAFSPQEQSSEEGQTLHRLFLNTANLDETLMP